MSLELFKRPYRTIIGLLLVIPLSALAESEPMDTATPFYHERHEGLTVPGQAELRELELLFQDFLSPKTDQADGQTPASPPGFATAELDIGRLLYDAEGRGWGYYLLRPDDQSPLLLQAPHQFFDRDTGKISVALFEQGVGRALAMNSAHRYANGRGRPDTDWAHMALSPLNAFTRAFLVAHPDATVIQIHGYAEKKRRTEAGRQSDMILSSGQRWPHPAMVSIADCLSERTDWRVLKYPEDVSELGGTTNIQGRLMSGLGNPRFVHVELSSSLRRTLINDEQALATLAICLSGGESETQ